MRNMRHKVLAAILLAFCGMILAVIGVVSCQTPNTSGDSVDLSGATGIKQPPCGILPCPCSAASVLPCKEDMAVARDMAIKQDMSVLYACCSKLGGNCSDCASDAGAGPCSTCELVVSTRAMCAIECPPVGDMAAPVVQAGDMRPACFGQTCSSTVACCTPTAMTLPIGTISGPTPICLTSGCGLYVTAACPNNNTTKICTTTDGVSWSCRTCG